MTVLKGLDTIVELTRYAATLKQTNGFDFVMRYYSHRAAKNLSLGEARALSAAQLQIGVVWETLGTHAGFFTHEQGVADGSAAFQMASAAIGQPRDSAIYFAVDYDATQADLDGPVSAYFAGVRDVFTLAAKGAAQYQVGVYGSGLACSYLLKKELAAFTWLSQSTGFAGSTAFREEGRYNLIQKMPQKVQLGGGQVLQYDPDESNPALPTGLFSL